MICKNCGKEIDDDSIFCEHCGFSNLQKPKKLNIKKVLTIILLLFILLAAIIAIYVGIYKHTSLVHTMTIDYISVNSFEKIVEVNTICDEYNKLVALYPYSSDNCNVYEAGLLHDLDSDSYEINPGYSFYEPTYGYWYDSDQYNDSWCFNIADWKEKSGSKTNQKFVFDLKNFREGQVYNFCVVSTNMLWFNDIGIDMMPEREFYDNYYRFTNGSFVSVDFGDLNESDILLEKSNGHTYPTMYIESAN